MDPWADACLICHGERGEGPNVVTVQNMSLEDFLSSYRRAPSHSVIVTGIDPEDLKAIYVYLRSVGAPQLR